MMSLPAISEAIAAPEENNAAKSEEKNEQDLSVSEEMARLREKRNRLEKKEKNLNKLEQEVNQKIQKLKKLQANIQQMLDEAKVVKDKKIKHLVDVYSNMKPKQAAQVLETLDQDIAVKILAGMRGRTAGEILSYVQADKAAQLSEDLTRLQMPFDQ
jgi:flagellar motility protein MotE (MotC chaperone)